MHEWRVDQFLQVYEAKLHAALAAHPLKYAYGFDEIPRVVAMTRQCLILGAYDTDGIAFKATCAHFKIRPTVTAVDRFLGRY